MEALENLTLREARRLIAAEHGLQLDDLVGFLLDFRTLLNPTDKEITVCYPLSGPDVFTPLLMADPSHLVMYEKGVINPALGRKDDMPATIRNYLQHIFPAGLLSIYQANNNFYPWIMAQLHLLGVDPSSIRFMEEKEGTVKRFQFVSCLPGNHDQKPKLYTITIINQKLEILPDKGETTLAYHQDIIPAEGFDIWFSKGDLPVSIPASIVRGIQTYAFIRPGIATLKSSGKLKQRGLVVSDIDLSRELGEGYQERALPADIDLGAMKLRSQGYQFGYSATNLPHIYERL